MVDRVFNKILNFENKFTLGKATLIIAIGTVISRVVGLLRTRLLAGTFGAGDILDVYFASFRVPDFLMNLFVLGTLTVAFLPVFTNALLTSHLHAKRLAQTVLGAVFIGMAGICFMVWLFLFPLLHWLLPGFSSSQILDTYNLTSIILLAQIVFAGSSLISTLLNSVKRFFWPAIAPILYNLAIMFGIVYLYPTFGLMGLGWGVLLGALLHLLVQLPELILQKFSILPRFYLRMPELRHMFRLYIPRLLFLDVAQISLLIGSSYGSILGSGAITVFSLAFDIQAVPVGVFAISTAVASFPLLAEAFSQKRGTDFMARLGGSLLQVCFFLVPISVAFLLYRAHIVRLLLGSGAFNWDDTRATFKVLGVMSFAIISQGVIPLLSRAFFARHDTKIPMFVSWITVVVNFFFARVLLSLWGVVGLAVAFVIASTLNACVLYIILRIQLGREYPEEVSGFDSALVGGVIKILVASLGLAVAGYITLYIIAPFLDTRTFAGLLAQSAFSAIVGGAVYFWLANVLGLKQAGFLASFLRKFFAK